MSEQLLQNSAAENEANQIGAQFANSNDVMGDMGKTFNFDFSGVNMHGGADGDSNAANHGDLAYAKGNDVYFGGDILNQHTPEANMAVGHELTHVMQQNDGAGVSEHVPFGESQGLGFFGLFRNLFSGKKKDSTETEASVNEQTEDDEPLTRSDAYDWTNDKSNEIEPENTKGNTEDPAVTMLKNIDGAKSSKEMKRIKDAFAKIDSLMSGNIPSDKNQFSKQQTERVAAYNEIIESCDTYIASKNPYTSRGKRRKAMVVNVKAIYEKELAVFEATSTRVFSGMDEGESVSWRDILSEIRTVSINMDDPGNQVEMGGAGTSEVFICTINGKKYYFKKSEMLEGISTKDMAYRDMESADKDSTLGRFNSLINQKKENKAQFETFLEQVFEYGSDYLYQDFSDPNIIKTTKDKFIKYVVDEGFDGKLIEKMFGDNEDEARAFFKYLKELQKNQTKNDVTESAGIKKGSDLSSRNVASSRVANLLGVSDLLAGSKNVNLTYQGKTMKGNMMDEATGDAYAHIANQANDVGEKLEFTSNVLSQLQSLQVLDYICGQVDRNMGNFLCEVDKSKSPWVITKITGIDNDMSFGELTLDNFKGAIKLPRLVSAIGRMSISALEGGFADTFFNLSPELLKYSLKDLLSAAELDAAVKRLTFLQEFVRENIENKKISVLDKDDEAGWQETHKKNMSRYLSSKG